MASEPGTSHSAPEPPNKLGAGPLILLTAALLISACGLVYELVAGALASYLVGDTITRFSTVIGTYLFAMGVGAWLARYVRGDALARFVEIEIATGLIGGFSAMLLFAAFAANALFEPLLYGIVFIVGALVGVEIPLLLRLLKGRLEFEDLVSRVLSLDYLGALVASLVFPLWFVPALGLVRTALAFGILNVLVAMVTLWFFRRQLRAPGLWAASVLALIALGAGMAEAERFSRQAEERLYRAQVVLAEQTPYQRIALMQRAQAVRLYLNGRLQFSSRDEYRYHEALVHPALAAVERPRRVLVLGGGDGLAVREILRHPSIEAVTLIDIDQRMTELFKSNVKLAVLNQGSLADPRVTVVNADAWRWLESTPASPEGARFDAVVMDLPDPSNFAIGRLYSAPFFRLVERHLKPGGLIVSQATSPDTVREAFWCIVTTLESTGLTVTPYHMFLPSFGGWGFVIATRGNYRTPDVLPTSLKFLTPAVLRTLFTFSPDIDRLPVEPNRLDKQSLVGYYDRGWRAARNQ